MEQSIGIKSKERVKAFGEVFTPSNIVKDMCDLGKLKEYTYMVDKTFLEPSCGTGNFLVELLDRKMQTVLNLQKAKIIEVGTKNSLECIEYFELNTIKSICSIYGVDIQLDNVLESRERLNSIIAEYFRVSEYEYSEDMKKAVDFILCRNIIVGDTLKAVMAPYKPLRRGGRQSEEMTERLQFIEWEFRGAVVNRTVNRMVQGEKTELIPDNTIEYPSSTYKTIHKIPRGMEETVGI